MSEFKSNRITLFREQYDAISKLPIATQGKVYKALMDYNFTGSIPKLDATSQLAFDLIKVGLDVSLTKQRAGQAGGNQKASNASAESKQESSKALAEEKDRGCQSYEDIIDDLCVAEEVRPILWEFIKHCQANGHTLINSKLRDIIVRLDFTYGNAEKEKIKSIKKAISGGYFDIAEGK